MEDVLNLDTLLAAIATIILLGGLWMLINGVRGMNDN